MVRTVGMAERGMMIVKSEEVGLASQRLARLRTHFQRHIDAGQLAGTLTLVVCQGQIASCEPQGPACDTPSGDCL